MNKKNICLLIIAIILYCAVLYFTLLFRLNVIIEDRHVYNEVMNEKQETVHNIENKNVENK